MAEVRAQPLKAADVEKRLQTVLQSTLSDQELRAELEELAKQPAFYGFTWLWGPDLYRRNRVMFRPFILAHFGTWLVEPKRVPVPVKWDGEKGRRLDEWLTEVDQRDDVELFRRLYQWKIERPGTWRLDRARIQLDLLKRFKEAPSGAGVRTVLAKFDLWFELDETAAMELYGGDPAAAKPFILKHLPSAWLGGDKRALWEGLASLALKGGDEDLHLALYRRQAPLKRIEQDMLALCDSIQDPQELVQELRKRHPEGYGFDLGALFFKLVQKRGRDVLPYILKNLRQVHARFLLRGGYDRLLDLAREKEWPDLWSFLVRICANQKDYNREIDRLLESRLDDSDVQRRLLMLAGVSREWNLGGFGLAQVQQLEESTALRFYERFPDLVRGPFKLHLSSSAWARPQLRLIGRLIQDGDETLIDFLASRAATRIAGWFSSLKEEQTEAIEKLALYYEKLRDDPAQFSRRASAVLGQIPAYSIYRYGELIRQNRLARLLFERSSSSFLADPAALQDLIEAPEIHVQAMAYRALGLDDDRARAIASANIEILLATLLRPIHRKTRALAFGALANAASTSDDAQRVLSRAREALALPDIRYPKEQLVGLIGKILWKWPELRGEAERPVVYGEVRA
ncbi:MAG: gliding motility protein [Acidobacteriota bacterium]